MKLFILIAALLLQTPSSQGSQGPRGSVTGTVIVSGTSEPIADADVAIVTPDGLLETTTDANGRFARGKRAGRPANGCHSSGRILRRIHSSEHTVPRTR